CSMFCNNLIVGYLFYNLSILTCFYWFGSLSRFCSLLIPWSRYTCYRIFSMTNSILPSMLHSCLCVCSWGLSLKITSRYAICMIWPCGQFTTSGNVLASSASHSSCTSVIIFVGFIISMSYRVIMLSVGSMVHHTVIISWNSVIIVPRSVNIMWIKNIDITCVVRKSSMRVVVNIKSSNSRHISKAIIVYINITYLTYSTIKIIINWNVFYLNNSSKFIVL